VLRSWLLALVGLGACTSSTTVTVELAPDLPGFIAFRDGTSGWKTPKPRDGGQNSAHHFELEVSGDYEVVAVSLDPTSKISMELLATPDDGTYWYLTEGAAYDKESLTRLASDPGTLLSCNWPFAFAGTVPAKGTMAQSGIVSIGNMCGTSSNTGWSYQLWVQPGVHDVIAADLASPPRVSIQRGVMVDGTATLPPIDLGATGQLLATSMIVVVNTDAYTNDAGPISSELAVEMDGEIAVVAAGLDDVVSKAHVVPLVPASLLGPQDRQVLVMSVQDNTNAQRRAVTTSPAASPVIELLDLPVASFDIAGNIETASWSDGLSPRVQAIDVSISNATPSSPITRETVTATARWLAGNHTSNLGFDGSVPGYDPSWAVDLTQPRWSNIATRAIEGDVEYMTARSLSN
jgi:hypothetical protein